MANKAAHSAGPKARQGATNAVLSASSDRKTHRKSDPGHRPDSHGSSEPVSAEMRRLMIAEAAYYISASRGFEAGREMEDWLLAERQVDAVLAGVGAQAA